MYAIIEIGTNSVRAIEKVNNTFKTYRLVPRLGAEEKDGFLSMASVMRTIDAIKTLQNEISYPIKIYATSALREARNRQNIKRYMEKEIGTSIRILTGDEEGQMAWKGVTQKEHIIDLDALWVLDIGGGSTESIYMQDSTLNVQSEAIGAVRLSEDRNAFKNMSTFLKKLIPPFQPQQVFLTGGTAYLLSELVEHHPSIYKKSLIIDALKRFKNSYSRLSSNQQKQLLGSNQDRADILLAGTDIILFLMQEAQLDVFGVTDSDMLEGLFYTCNPD